jgi:hypothetical protein
MILQYRQNMTSGFFVLLCPALMLSQDLNQQDQWRSYFIQRFERTPLAYNYQSAQFAQRDYLLRKLYTRVAFNQFAGAERLARDFGQNNLSQTHSISSPHSRASNSSDEVREAWVNHFSTELAPSNDHVSGMALDRFGNVYVTGNSSNSPFGNDFLTAKYNAAGKLLWKQRAATRFGKRNHH